MTATISPNGAGAPDADLASRLQALEHRLSELNAIVEVGQVLTGLLDMRDVLSYVVYLAESLVTGHSAGVALRADDGESLLLHNCTGALREAEGHQIPLEGSLLGWVVQTGESAVTSSVANDPRSSKAERQQGPGVAVPITSSGRVVGAFAVSRLPGAAEFAPESVALLQKISAYAAIAIQNAETHQAQEQTAAELRNQASALERAYDDLTRSQEQLLVSEKMAALGRVTASIAHEINSPLASILNSLKTAGGFVEEYRSSVGDPEITPEDHRAIADDITNALSMAQTASTKVAEYVRSIKNQTRAGDGDRLTFDPAVEIDSTIVLVQHEIKRRGVAVYTEMERGHALTGDRSKFGVVVQNLVSNAMDAYDGESGEVWIRLAAKTDTLELSVEDRGCGIPEEIRGRIYDYLFTTKDVGKGTGLGLAMVHNVVTTSFGGTIDLQSEVGIGTTFTLRFPLIAAETTDGA